MIDFNKKQKLALELLQAIKNDYTYKGVENNTTPSLPVSDQIKSNETVESKRTDKRHNHPNLYVKINGKEYTVLDFSISGAKLKIDAWDFTGKNSSDFFAVFYLNDKNVFVKCRAMWIDRTKKEIGIKFMNISETSWQFFNNILMSMTKSNHKPKERKKFLGIF